IPGSRMSLTPVKSRIKLEIITSQLFHHPRRWSGYTLTGDFSKSFAQLRDSLEPVHGIFLKAFHDNLLDSFRHVIAERRRNRVKVMVFDIPLQEGWLAGDHFVEHNP